MIVWPSLGEVFGVVDEENEVEGRIQGPGLLIPARNVLEPLPDIWRMLLTTLDHGVLSTA